MFKLLVVSTMSYLSRKRGGGDKTDRPNGFDSRTAASLEPGASLLVVMPIEGFFQLNPGGSCSRRPWLFQSASCCSTDEFRIRNEQVADERIALDQGAAETNGFIDAGLQVVEVVLRERHDRFDRTLSIRTTVQSA